MKYFCIFLSSLLVLSCNQNSSQSDKQAIKDLQDRVMVLEKELQEMKTKTGAGNNTNDTKQNSAITPDYFTIGSSEQEVINVMGDPTSYYDFGSGGKRFQYGTSSVVFHKGKVESYHNSDGNLKVKVKK